MKIKGNLFFLISVVFVILVFGSMTITGCGVQKRTTHEDDAIRRKRNLQQQYEGGAQPPQPEQPEQPAKGNR